jgi:hypothetical protein
MGLSASPPPIQGGDYCQVRDSRGVALGWNPSRRWRVRTLIAGNVARLLVKERRRDEALTMLAQIYNWFTEGFDTADLTMPRLCSMSY